MRYTLTLFAVLLLARPGSAQGAPPEGRSTDRAPVIVNQAADAIICYLYQKLNPQPGKGATRDMVLAALDRIVDQYQDTGVSHVFWNVNYQRVAYRSNAWPSYWDVPDPEQSTTEWPRGYYELHKLGIDDVFARLIPRSRERGLSPWISLRMNDHPYGNDLAETNRKTAASPGRNWGVELGVAQRLSLVLRSCVATTRL